MRTQMMNFKHYNDVLSTSIGPIKKSELPNVTADYRGLISYAKTKGVPVTELSQKEKDMFIKVVK